jgi:hypothetical protein
MHMPGRVASMYGRVLAKPYLQSVSGTLGEGACIASEWVGG